MKKICNGRTVFIIELVEYEDDKTS